MNRRGLLAGGAGLLLAQGLASRAAARGDALATAAEQAWIYGVMLIENANARKNSLALVPANQLRHARVLTTPATQSVTAPNNDTLYSRAWIDLNGGPVTLDLPKTGSRYLSYHFMDMYGNSFAILGTRTTGGEAHRVTLVGPMQETSDPLAVRSPTPWVWLLIRTLIDGDEDLPAANAIQDGIKLTAPARPAPAATATRDRPWNEFFGSVQSLLIENPPPATDIAFFDKIAPLGLKPGGGFDASRFSAADVTRIQTGIMRARQAVNGQRAGQIVQGWVYPKATLGDFGQDYFYRAQVAIAGLAALTPAEAMYMRPVPPDGGQNLDASKPLALRFAKGQAPAVNAFWSLTAYARTPEGQSFFFDNPINRYAIGDRTKGLKYASDGSLEIIISRTDPGGARSSNWLPAPPNAPMGLSLRAYLPKPEFYEGTYRLPALVAA